MQTEIETTSVPSHFVKVETWAAANGIGVNSVYEFCRHKTDPIPHLRIGTKILIDNELAVVWMRQTFGRGTEAAA